MDSKDVPLNSTTSRPFPPMLLSYPEMFLLVNLSYSVSAGAGGGGEGAR